MWPNPTASAADQRRADITIRLYGLNEHGRPTCRKEQRRRWQKRKADGEDLDCWPCREFLATD